MLSHPVARPSLCTWLADALSQTKPPAGSRVDPTHVERLPEGEVEILALRIQDKGSVFVFQDVPVPGMEPRAGAKSGRTSKRAFKGRRILAPGGIAFRGIAVCVCWVFGRTVFQPGVQLRLRAACRALGVGEITAHGLRQARP